MAVVCFVSVWDGRCAVLMLVVVRCMCVWECLFGWFVCVLWSVVG